MRRLDVYAINKEKFTGAVYRKRVICKVFFVSEKNPKKNGPLVKLKGELMEYYHTNSLAAFKCERVFKDDKLTIYNVLLRGTKEVIMEAHWIYVED